MHWVALNWDQCLKNYKSSQPNLQIHVRESKFSPILFAGFCDFSLIEKYHLKKKLQIGPNRYHQSGQKKKPVPPQNAV